MLAEHHRTGAAAALMDAGIDVGGGDTTRGRCGWASTRTMNARNAFYRKHGFAVTGTRTFQLGASLEDDFVMVRPLSG